MLPSTLHILPFGPPAWERRREILAGIIASRGPEAGGPAPPWDFRDVLYLVPNERMVKSVRALFLDALWENNTPGKQVDARRPAAARAACIPPAVMALNRFIQSRTGGAKIISPLARKLLLEEVCQGLKGKVPGLEDEALARSLSGPVSEALERAYLHNAGDGLDNINDSSPLLRALARAKNEYERRLSELGLVDPARLLSRWEPKPENFSEYRLIVLDGFYDALPHELRLMKALADGRTLYFILEAPGLSGVPWEAGGVSGETGGAPEAGTPVLSGEGMPYAGTQRLINELFPDAKINVEFKPDYPAAAEEDADLFAGAVFLGRPLRETVRLLKATGLQQVNRRIVSALTPEDEVAFIARTIKERALKGHLNLDRTLVLFPEPTRYSHAFRKIMGDYGIPYSFQEVKPLIGLPLTQTFLDLLSIPAQDYPFRLMRRAFYTPLVRLGGAGNDTVEFDKYARDEGITGGRRRWERLAHGAKLPFTPELAALLDLLKPLDSREMHPAKWAELASGLLEQSGIAKRAEELPIDALISSLEELQAPLKNLTSKVTLGRFIGILKGALSEVQAVRKVDAFSGVRVLGRLEAFSEGFDTVFIAGLNSGSFPTATRRDLFSLDGKGAGSASLDAKTRDSRLFMGLILGAREVYLSYPKESGGKPSSPSPWIMALGPFVIAGAAEEIIDYCRPSAPEDALGEEEFLRALSMGGYEEAGTSSPEGRYPQDYRSRIDDLALKTASSEDITAPAPPTVQKRRFSVTELEDYIKCPYRYYHRWVLRDRPPEEPSDDAAPDASGRAVHSILAKFYARRPVDWQQAGRRPVHPDEVKEAYKELSKLDDEEFAGLADTLANREAKRKFLEKIAPKVLAADGGLPPGTVIKDVEKKVEGELPVSDTETVTVVGKIDRLELSGGGSFAVVDYKTGRYPGNGAPLKNGFQLPLYAYLLRKYLPEQRPSAFVYYNLGKTGETRDVVCYDTTLHSGKAVSSKERKREGGAEMDEYIDGIAEKASEAARGIIAGEFPEAKKPEECRYCEVADACPGADEEEE